MFRVCIGPAVITPERMAPFGGSPTLEEASMKGKSFLLLSCLAAFGCAQSPTQQASVPVQLTKAANPDLPQGVPGWKQGMSDQHATSTLAPHAGKMTVTPESEIPVSSLKVPRSEEHTSELQ